MARLILKSDYLKPGDKAHILENLQYIATRDGVALNDQASLEKYTRPLQTATANYAVSDRQYDLIEDLLQADDRLKESLPYEEFEKNANMYTASVFISEAIETLYANDFNNKDYLKYIAERPGVKLNDNTDHGLFDAHGTADFKQYYQELADHKGNVWRNIISLRREDACMYGYENQEAWRTLVNNHVSKLAENMGIDLDHMRWTAAFHDEGYHPHVHMMLWSTNPKEGFQNKADIEEFRRVLTKDVFANEIWLREQFKAEIRSDFEEGFKREFDCLSDQAYKQSKEEFPTIADKLQHLADALPERGKLQYSYLKPEIKQICNDIVQSILDSDQLRPLMEKYLESQRILASMYMKDGSDSMKEYMLESVNRLISPHKQDRKVLHNYILSVAGDVKVKQLQNKILLSSKLLTLDEKLDAPKRIEVNEEVGISLLKLQVLRCQDPIEAIHSVTSYFQNEDAAKEAYLDIKDNNEFTEEDLKRINACFHESIAYDTSTFSQSELPIHEAMKIFQQVLIGLGNGKAQADREAHRVFIAHRMDERNLKILNKKK